MISVLNDYESDYHGFDRYGKKAGMWPDLFDRNMDKFTKRIGYGI